VTGATVIGTDTGSIDLNPDRFGNFAALITITEGTGMFANSRGQLVLRGRLDFQTGAATGDYTGRVCSNR
jgi:hypothetical protein